MYAQPCFKAVENPPMLAKVAPGYTSNLIDFLGEAQVQNQPGREPALLIMGGDFMRVGDDKYLRTRQAREVLTEIDHALAKHAPDNFPPGSFARSNALFQATSDVATGLDRTEPTLAFALRAHAKEVSVLGYPGAEAALGGALADAKKLYEGRLERLTAPPSLSGKLRLAAHGLKTDVDQATKGHAGPALVRVLTAIVNQRAESLVLLEPDVARQLREGLTAIAGLKSRAALPLLKATIDQALEDLVQRSFKVDQAPK
jgi:hypothetical protein